MNWNEKCLLELDHHSLFESTGHRQRFRELVDCFYMYPFFTKGVCKCIYLASWDDEHFAVILAVLNAMTVSGSKNFSIMSDEGEALAENATGSDAMLYDLSNALLNDTAYTLPDFTMIDPDLAHMIKRTLLASTLIDDLPDPHQI